jgi:hypothetical protein
MFFYSYDITAHALKEASHYLGAVPRNCLTASHSKRDLREQQSAVQRKVSSIPMDVTFYKLFEGTLGSNDLSHHVFELRPMDSFRIFDEALVHAASGWIMILVLEEYEKRTEGTARKFYEYFSKSPFTVPLSGIIGDFCKNLQTLTE